LLCNGVRGTQVHYDTSYRYFLQFDNTRIPSRSDHLDRGDRRNVGLPKLVDFLDQFRFVHLYGISV
jgi:hypothetical protein